MNKKLLVSAILCAFLLTGCGSGDSMMNESMTAVPKNSKAVGGDISYNADTAENNYGYEGGSVAKSPASSENGEEKQVDSTDAIKKEMLVYSCNMTVDVLDFKAAEDSFKSSLETYGAFIETENYSDGGSNGRYIYDYDEKWQTYTATVRVPSKDYESFCETAASLGDLREKNASVENLSQEYYDLSAELDIYEAKEKRYMALLDSITEEEYAIAVEKELTDIEIQISKLRTRMNNIKTDVAYSYVYITINEVKEYSPEPVKKDTFIQRLMNTVSDSAKSFLSFAEDVLFLIIYLFPHIIVIGIIVFIIVKIVKASKKRKGKLAEKPVPISEEKYPEENKTSESTENTDK